MAQVEYRNVYPGVDIDYYGDDQHLQYQLVFHPGAGPSQIRTHFEGAESTGVPCRVFVGAKVRTMRNHFGLRLFS
jgi:hypothetical protein